MHLHGYLGSFIVNRRNRMTMTQLTTRPTRIIRPLTTCNWSDIYTTSYLAPMLARETAFAAGPREEGLLPLPSSYSIQQLHPQSGDPTGLLCRKISNPPSASETLTLAA